MKKSILRVVACVALIAAVSVSTGCALGVSAEKTKPTKKEKLEIMEKAVATKATAK